MEMSPDMVRDLGQRLAPGADARLAPAFLAIVAGIHDLLGALRPTPDELTALIAFLTEVGHTADARRQEWVLLADVLGVSARVEELNRPCPQGATPHTLPGPFYRADAPEVAQGGTLSRDGLGEPLHVHLRLQDLEGHPLPEALVEVWHANALGRYENQDPDLQPEFNLRGKLRADAAGEVRFHTIKPRGYALPGDGPVGQLLRKLGLPLERPAHLHFRVSAPGLQTLTTHIFDQADPAITRDALFGVRPELLAAFRAVPGGHALDTTLVLTKAPT
ncbi:dioxygenase [Stagnihabitans tardus]|uniref:6-chlorohydroxyquinol-1,2-dioxygenase n=1 Tax=Stagnihabitans tardus TaxID=2699202 RepID=A0AAE5BU25_9RHOB|nr:dioxygenase [Stagnihabitans tardus]NBZ87306.1 6-chlorohydroxyquinol-1,2-dioxygenase [Stagnihabitans tardus]